MCTTYNNINELLIYELLNNWDRDVGKRPFLFVFSNAVLL